MKNIMIFMMISLAVAVRVMNPDSCVEVKRLGQQKDYCEGNFLNDYNECIAGFCLFCCKDDIQCNEKCLGTHGPVGDMYVSSTCAYKTMGPSFEGFCKNLISDNIDNQEFIGCVASFCEDCCFKELKLSDGANERVIKCKEVCMPPTQVISIESLHVPLGTKGNIILKQRY
jgi:hypothetical protein